MLVTMSSFGGAVPYSVDRTLPGNKHLTKVWWTLSLPLIHVNEWTEMSSRKMVVCSQGLIGCMDLLVFHVAGIRNCLDLDCYFLRVPSSLQFNDCSFNIIL